MAEMNYFYFLIPYLLISLVFLYFELKSWEEEIFVSSIPGLLIMLCLTPILVLLRAIDNSSFIDKLLKVRLFDFRKKKK